ncbi:MAG: glutathione S-transferase family protein [Alphaproteobacteria bacterium]|nr:glutathione S-transferase family protein [Alphaproteobacteria bacterium]
MPTLLQHRLDPSCRLVRLMLGEYGVDPKLEDVSHWKRDARLVDIDPAATVPLLLEDGTRAVIGPSAVMHHIEAQHAPSQVAGLIPVDIATRAEMWRMYDWVMLRLNDEVTRYVLEEKIGKRELGQGSPDPSALRAAKANLSEHMQYFAYLLATRRWLAGPDLTLADFALAAHLSALDYLGDVSWDVHEEVKSWFARLKSRPAFRPLLSDRVIHMPPSRTYADLDF